MDGSGSLTSLRELNRGRVIESLRELGVGSRAEIARSTGLSPATVSTLVSQLVAAGMVVDAPRRVSRRGQGGRPPALITLDPSVGVAIGIDFGKRHLAVAVSDLSHEILAERWRTMHEDYDARTGMDGAVKLVEEALERSDADRDRVLGVGLGLPGPIHRSTGMVGSSAILPGWTDVRIAEVMSERLQLPVHVDNDANLGALAEFHWGAGRNASPLVYLKMATGIGAGIVVGGRLFHGAGGTAGEIGHTTVDEAGPICRCGNRGCLEMVAAAPALAEMLRATRGSEMTSERVVELALEGDPGCRRAIADAGRYTGNALAGLCNLLNPERIVVGGSLGAAGNVLIDPLREAVRRRVIPSAVEDVEIVPGVLADRAELLGAVALVLNEKEQGVVASQPLGEAVAS
ncbi:MAG TPA: ROK family transcriptional regulator [Solirubrobacteraceae bacterium]|nr:ROK family transcriptional regulator [Solirubrobacteraceae bacterium]